jgi:hypothetical protein
LSICAAAGSSWPPCRVRNCILDPLAILAGKLGQATVGRRNGRLEAGFEHAGQQWGGAAACDRYQERRAVNHCRHDEVAEFRVVGDVDRYSGRGAQVVQFPVGRGVRASPESEHATVEIICAQIARLVLDPVFLHQADHAVIQRWGNHSEVATGTNQKICLACSDLAATDKQGATSLYIEENG